MLDELFNILKINPFLVNQTHESIKDLASKAKEVKFSKNALILAEGDETTSVYFIISGRVRIYSSDEKSKEITLAIQEAGTFFGELELFSNEPVRSASVQALDTTLCAVILKNDFVCWLNQHPEAVIVMLGQFSKKIRFLTEKIKQMCLTSAYERMVRVLHELAINEDGILIIQNRPTDDHLAKLIGSQRETINKFLNELIKGGYILKEGKTLKILKKLPLYF